MATVGSYLIRRILLLLPLLIGLSIVMFTLIHLAPGDPALAFISEQNASADFIEQTRKNLGLDKPLPVQYVIWLGKLARGDLGTAYTFNQQPVLGLILERLGATMSLQALGLLLALLIAIPVGIISATRQYSALDNATTVGAFLGLALPNFWLALLLQLFFSVRLGWLPVISTGQESAAFPGRLRFFVLPVVVVALPLIAFFSRFMRSAMLEVLRQDYMTTARAKGLIDRTVLYRHGFRNALIPMVTVIGLQLPRIIGGAVIVEQIFAWPGIGQLVYEAITRRDYPVILGVTIFIGAFVMVVNIVVDLIYVLIDPRVAFAGGRG